VTPVRDPEARHLRRLERDLAAAARRDREGERRGGSPRRDEPADEETPSGLAGWSDDELERLPPRAKHGGRRAAAARRRADRWIGEPTEPPASGTTRLATVVATARGPCEVELDDGGAALAHLPKALARADRSVVAVGDRVEVAVRPSGDLVVARLLPRRSRLTRPDPFDPRRERVLVANLDLGVVVASLRRPPLSPGLIDRFLVAFQHGDVAAAIAVNKADLADADARADAHALLAPYRDLGVPLAFCSARTGEGLDEVRRWIAGRAVAFVGHSGVGKSSLLNALAPGAEAAVGEVSAQHGKGRHTTTRARVYRLADGTRIVDTPGVREFGLRRLAPAELAAYFDEFAPFAAECRFRDCSHVHEPGCAVRAAAERSAIAPERFATYLRILASFDSD
jgi:ribosome biogenesis GTPase